MRLSTETSVKLEKWAEQQGVSRSEALRTLLERALKRVR